MQSRFDHVVSAGRVLFGPGRRAELGAEIDRLGAKTPLVVSTPEQGSGARQIYNGPKPTFFAGARLHTPVEVTQSALAILEQAAADCIVSIGGGSAIGLGKALALRSDLPQICIPTTYAGSEMTPILGQTENGVKTTLRSPAVLPETVIYDVELTLSLPISLSGTSGMNAIAHAAEALYAADGNPVISLMAEEGIRALAASLPIVARDPGDLAARTEALYGAWLCGTCLGSAGMALHHKLCHALGGAFDLPHAALHAVLLPYSLGYNAPATPAAIQRLGRATGHVDPVQGLFQLNRRLGNPASLEAIGMPEEGLARVAELVAVNPYWNPRPIDAQAVATFVARAFRGLPPEKV